MENIRQQSAIGIPSMESEHAGQSSLSDTPASLEVDNRKSAQALLIASTSKTWNEEQQPEKGTFFTSDSDEGDEGQDDETPVVLAGSPLTDLLLTGTDSLSLEQAIFSGFLKKKGERRRTWKKRWFVLRPDRLHYYKNEKEYELLTIIYLKDVHSVASVPLDKRPFVFGLVTKSRTYLFQAPTEALRDHWLLIIKEALQKVQESLPGKAESPFTMGVRHTGSFRTSDVSQSLVDSNFEAFHRSSTMPILYSSSHPPSQTTGTVNSVFLGSPTFPSYVLTSDSEGGGAPTTFVKRQTLVNEEIAGNSFNQTQTLRSPPSISATTTTSILTHATSAPSKTSLDDVEDDEDEDDLVLTEGVLDEEGTVRAPIAGILSVDAASPVPLQHVSFDIPQSSTVPSVAKDEPILSNSSPLSSEASPVSGIASAFDDNMSYLSSSPGTYSQNPNSAYQEQTSGTIIRQGFLRKQQQSKIGKPFKKRWFVLRQSHILTLYKNDKEYVALHVIDCERVLDVLEIDPVAKGHIYCFKIVDGVKEFILSASSEEERSGWIQVLRRCMMTPQS